MKHFQNNKLHIIELQVDFKEIENGLLFFTIYGLVQKIFNPKQFPTPDINHTITLTLNIKKNNSFHFQY